MCLTFQITVDAERMLHCVENSPSGVRPSPGTNVPSPTRRSSHRRHIAAANDTLFRAALPSGELSVAEQTGMLAG
ncbi:hypothetical protein [Klugiella xanthotipulae]|uniref:hypothetical protein n=1 Tax=Klugiella xanthotipulae TaxID=244735 RepID=UPI0014768F35|nr:hypothetical protein [Klugiella xanthotipulae]